MIKIFVCKAFCRHVLSFLLEILPRFEFQVIGGCIINFNETAKQFFKVVVPFYTSASCLNVLVALQLRQYLVFLVFFILTFPVGE